MTVIHALIAAIADARDTDMEDLEVTIEDHVSTDAIRQLECHEDESWTLQFELQGHSVYIDGEGTIVVTGTRTRPCT